MISADRESFDRQAAHWRKRADQARGIVSHVIWRDGQMEATITPRCTAPVEDPAPRSSRGVAQGMLI